MPLPDEKDWLNIEHRVEKLEGYGESNTKDISGLKKEVEKLKKVVADLKDITVALTRATIVLKDWQVLHGAGPPAYDRAIKAYELLEEKLADVRKRLGIRR